jgi:hypothetical protein
MSLYSNQDMEEIGEGLGRIFVESKYPKTYLCLYLSVLATSGYIIYNYL